MIRYFIGIVLFAIGLIIVTVTGCDGYWQNCWQGWTKLGIIMCSVGVCGPFIAYLAQCGIRVYSQKRNDSYSCICYY